jgi:hypothetical protein
MLLSADFEEPHNYEARISYLRHCGNPINLAPTEEIADCKSAKPINMVTLCGIKCVKNGIFPVANCKFKNSESFCTPSHFFFPPMSGLLKIQISLAGHQCCT